jgi:hypothetical protein
MADAWLRLDAAISGLLNEIDALGTAFTERPDRRREKPVGKCREESLPEGKPRRGHETAAENGRAEARIS